MTRNVGSFRTIAEGCIDAEGIAPACRLSETKLRLCRLSIFEKQSARSFSSTKVNPHEGLILGGRNVSGAGGD